MKMTTLTTAAILALTSTVALAQSTNAPGASTIGGEANPNAKNSSTSGGASSQTGGGMTGGSASGGMTSGSSTKPAMNDASKSGAPAADNAMKPRGTTTPDNSPTTR